MASLGLNELSWLHYSVGIWVMSCQVSGIDPLFVHCMINSFSAHRTAKHKVLSWDFMCNFQVCWEYMIQNIYPGFKLSIKKIRISHSSHEDIDGLVQDCSNSSALAMESLQSCTKPSIWFTLYLQIKLRVKFSVSILYHYQYSSTGE